MSAIARPVLVMLAWFLLATLTCLGLARVVLTLILVGLLSQMRVSRRILTAPLRTELCEVIGDRPARRGFISVVCRIGRVFMNRLPSELLSRNAGVCVLGDLNNIDPLSDHSPVLFALGGVPKGGGSRGGVPRWVADRSDFPDLWVSSLRGA